MREPAARGMASARTTAITAALAVMAAVLATTFAGAPAASAANVITVTTTADVTDPNDGLTSLREAVALANTQVGDDTIVLAASATYPLTQCPPYNSPVTLLFNESSSTVTIEGNGSTIRQDCVAARAGDVTTIQSNGPSLLLRSVTVALAGKAVLMPFGTTLTMEHAAIVGATGDCVDAYSAQAVTLRFSRIDGCGGNGVLGPISGRLFPLDISDSEITGAASPSWGAFVTTQLTLVRSSVHDNAGGGGIVNGPAIVTESHVDRNGGRDAGLFAIGTLVATDSTFDDNTSTGPPLVGATTIAGVTGAGTSTFTRVSASRNHTTMGVGHAGIGLYPGVSPTTIEATVVDSHVDANDSLGTGTGRSTAGIATIAGGFSNAPTGWITISGTTVERNVAPDNAGVFTTVPTTIMGSSISGSSFVPGGSQQGAGAVVVLEHLTMSGSTVSQNTTRHEPTVAYGSAGAVFARYAELDNTTITGNTGDVGGVVGYFGATLVHVTLADNSGTYARNLAAQGAISIAASSFSGPAQGSVPNCVLFPASATPNTSAGFNVVSDTTCPLTGTMTDVFAAGDPLLAPPAANGGATETRVALSGSPLRDRIPASVTDLCSGTDQRGVARPQGPACDVGAVEALGSRFHALAPTRILDSRLRPPGFDGPLAAGTPRSLVVTGGNVPATAAAVVVNVTVTGSTANSFLTVWPDGKGQPNASAINFATGQTIPNLVTVMVGAGGKVAFSTNQGATEVVVDLLGYYDDGTGAGDGWSGIQPLRVLDSRTITGGWNKTKLVAGTARELTVRPVGGASGVPVEATSVVANVTVTNGSANSFVTVWPAGQSQPTASNVNFARGETTANAVVVAVGDGGKIMLANQTGATDVVVDVVGYFTAGSGSRFFAVAPTRVLDDRVDVGVSGQWQAGQTRAVPLAGPGISANVVGVAANLTVTNGSEGSFLTVFPHGAPQPTASTINFGVGQTIANQAMVKVSAGQVDIFNQAGDVDVIADVVGYFAGP